MCAGAKVWARVRYSLIIPKDEGARSGTPAKSRDASASRQPLMCGSDCCCCHCRAGTGSL